jgi:ABC-type iron transport system FetAB ATPase subunit
MKIIIEGPAGCGKSNFIHGILIPALRNARLGAEFFDEHETSPSMTLTGPVPLIQVIERQTNDQR